MDNNYALDILNARHEKNDNWQKSLIVFLILALLITNTFWIYRELQYQEVVTETYTTTSDGDSVFVNGTGELNYGTDNIHENDTAR